METFEQRLCGLINEYSLENDSNTPDYILAKFMNDCLTAFNEAERSKTRLGDWKYEK